MDNYGKQTLFNETVFVFPFSYIGGLRKWRKYYKNRFLSRFWSEKNGIFSKYYLKHVLNKENSPLHYEYETPYMGVNLGDIIRMESRLNSRELPEEYLFLIGGISLIVFPTGIGFITLRIRYPEKTTIEDIANISAVMARVFPNERQRLDENGQDITNVKFFVDGQPFKLSDFLAQLVAQKEEVNIEFFPTTNSKRAFVFQKIMSNSVGENVKSALMRNLWPEKKRLHVETMLEKEFTLGSGRKCTVSPISMCVYCTEVNEVSKDIIRRDNNVRFSYFNLFLLCLHEQQALLLYNQRIVALGKHIKGSAKLKKELLRFLPSYSFKVVSAETSYQQMYVCLKEVLYLEELEDNLKDSITMLEAAYIQGRDSLLNAILAIISILGVVSLFADVITIMDILGK